MTLKSAKEVGLFRVARLNALIVSSLFQALEMLEMSFWFEPDTISEMYNLHLHRIDAEQLSVVKSPLCLPQWSGWQWTRALVDPNHWTCPQTPLGQEVTILMNIQNINWPCMAVQHLRDDLDYLNLSRKSLVAGTWTFSSGFFVATVQSTPYDTLGGEKTPYVPSLFWWHDTYKVPNVLVWTRLLWSVLEKKTF